MSELSKLEVIAASFKLFTSKQYQASVSYLPLTVNEKSTASTLFGYYNAKSGKCFPSYQTLAEATGFCRLTVIRHVKKLKELGIIKTVKQFYLCGKTNQRRQRSNDYHLNSERIRYLLSQKWQASKAKASKVLLSCVTAKQVSSQQVNNIKPMANLVSFPSITAMFKRKERGQYIDTKNGLMFKSFDDATNYVNAIGYVGKRKLSSIIASAAKYYGEHEPSKVLDQAWLDGVLSTMKKHEAERKALKALIDYQHFGHETETHKFFMNGRYFANAESCVAVRERDSKW